MSKVLRFPANEVGTDYFVGDIHGCLDLLLSSLKEIGFNEKKDRLFSVGDLVDRGDDSLGCLRFLRDNDWFHAIRGNHEQMLIDFHEGKWPCDNYLMNGGQWFYRLKDEEAKEAYDIAKSLPFIIEVGDIGIVHAQPLNNWEDTVYRIEADVPYAEKYIIWGRDVIRSPIPFTCDGIGKVFCGHTVVKEPVNRGNVKFIDTGAVFYGKLTICDSLGRILTGE